MSKLPGKIVIFDLDRTITSVGTFTPFCLYAAWRLDPLRLITLPVAVVALAATGLKVMRRKTLKTIMLALLIGRPDRARLDRVAADFVDRCLDGHVRDRARGAIEAARDQGAALYLATASYDFYADLFAERLGLEGCIATRSLWQDGRLRPGIDGENCYGPEKLRRIEERLQEDGRLDATDRPAITFYSDDRSDLPVLLWAGRAVVVTPKKGFARVAGDHGLDIEWW